MSGTGGGGASGGGSGSVTSSTNAADVSVQEVHPQVIFHFPYNINSLIVDSTLVASGTITQDKGMAQISSGAASSSSSLLTSVNVLEYNSGNGGSAIFSGLFDTGVTGNNQLMGIGNAGDGFFFGYEDDVFGILYRQNSVDIFIPQTTWNQNKADGTSQSGLNLDPTMGNQYQIKYQGYGFGNALFYIQNAVSGDFDLVHQINYTNINQVPIIFNPSLNFFALSENTTNTTDIIPKLCSVALYHEGINDDVPQVRHITSNSKSITTLESILTVRNKTTYQSVDNHVQCQLTSLSISTEGTKSVSVVIASNTTLGGVPSFSDVDTATSCMEVDIAGTTLTGGVFVAGFTAAATSSLSIDLRSNELFLAPGNTFTIAAASDNANEVFCTLNWEERFS